MTFHRVRLRLCAVISCALALSSLGCMKKKPVGDLVGVYAISGTLKENTCGQTALPTRSPLNYNVQIRSNDGVGTWQLDKGSPQSGNLDDDGSFLFEAEISNALGEQAQPKKILEPADFLDGDPEPDLNKANCTLVTRETMRGTLHRKLETGDGGSQLDAGDNGADLTGENTIEIQPAAGSDCSLQLASVGGAYLALPCTATYELEGSLQDAEK